MSGSYTVFWTAAAKKMLAGVTDRRIRKVIFERAGALTVEPDKQGKPLAGSLAGFRSLRVAGQRFRIIFRIDNEQVIVFVLAVGLRADGSRKDIYELAKKLVRLGIVEVDE